MATAHLRRRLVELEAAIIEQNLVLSALEQKKLAVQNELYTTATFPILTLPVEITAEIFSMCLPTAEELREEHLQSWSKIAKSNAPAVFLKCCRTWRDIALATPSLWATLSLSLSDDDFYPHEYESHESDDSNYSKYAHWQERVGRRVAELIDRWVNRAALYPLTFIFHANNTMGPLCGPFTPNGCIKDAIHRYSNRLKRLELVMDESDVRQLALASVHFPLLQGVVVHVIDSLYPPNPVEVFSNAPQLRELVLKERILLSDFSFPLAQLTRFEGEIDDMNLFIMAPNLVDVKFSVYDSLFCDYEDPTPVITLSCLQSLAISGASDHIPFILQHLTLPALLSLHLSETSVGPDYLSSFLLRSTPSLRTLSVKIADTFDDWAECFSLVEATLENFDVHLPPYKFISNLRLDS
ncbi:hypothetical protein B0H19DRAFT_114793 [Mycena capillaripes]|nr:hypothetical protein B0H19DRAFT_114793 [Mycena capillaripes]